MTNSDTSIPNGWKMTTLGEVAEIKGGKRLPKGKDLVSYKTKHPYIRITDLENNHIIKDQLQYITDDAFQSISKYIVNSNDVIISIVGSIGFVAKIDNDLNNANLTENCVKLVNLNNLDSKFLYYYLVSRLGQYEIFKNTVGAVQKKLPIYGVQNIQISLPPLSEQQAIATVLSSLDDKIELLREENKTLETVAQTIFKEWFVKFNFPGSTGKMIDSKLGEIPEEWRVGKYSDLVDVITGKGIKKQDLNSKGQYQVLGANGEIGKTNKYLFDEDLILTGRVGTLGTIYFSRDKVWISDNVLISKPLEKINYYYAYFQLKRINFESLNRGSTQPLITQTDLKNVEIIIPSNVIFIKWHDLSSSLFNKVFNNNSQIQTLSKIRDILLPKLMRGEIRVKGFKN